MTTDKILDWCVAKAKEAGIPESAIFDERGKSLEWLIEASLESGLGMAVLISLPSKNRDTDTRGEDLYRISVGVAIRANAALSNEEEKPYMIADRLFTAYNNASCYDSESYAARKGKQNTKTNSLAHSKWDDTDELHTFQIDILTTLD